MPVRLRPADPALVAEALKRFRAGDPEGADLRLLTKHLLALLVAKAPGGAVEVRVPPYAVAQCVRGSRHTRGTPPAVVETDAATWISLATGTLEWSDAEHVALLRASGERSDLSALMPLMEESRPRRSRCEPGPRVRAMTTHAKTTEDLRAAVRDVLPSVRADLETLVRIPSVSADPDHAEDVRRSAEATADLFRGEGFEDVRILSAGGGAPAVVARKPAPAGAPTVLLYAHHDVQPVGNIDDWDTEPFVPTERGDRLYGRGAADDKAGIAAHLAAIRAHGSGLPVGVTVFVEGEEEVGSPTLAAFLEEHAELLRADVIVIADSTNWDIGVPALTTSLRGLVDVFVEVSTLKHAVHSGLWGGVAPDAVTALIRLLATLHDEEGDVAVKGLVSGPAADVDYPVERVRAEAAMLDGVDFIGSGPLVERLWTKPAIATIGFDATRTADASNTLIPSATAKVSLRIAPGDSAESAQARLIEHLEANVPWGARLTVTPGRSNGEPSVIKADGPAYDAARAAFREAWDGTAPIDMGIGGSIPFIAALQEAFPEAAVLVTGVEDPDTRAHGANEGLHLREFERVCLAETLLLNNLGVEMR